MPDNKDSEKAPATGLEASDLNVGDERNQAEKDLATKTTEWDTERQERSQKHANERKDLQDKLDTHTERANDAEAQLAEMGEQLAELETKLSAKPTAPAKTDEADDSDLSEEEYGPMVKAIKGLRADMKAMATAPKADSSAEVAEFKERLSQLEGSLTQIADTTELNTVLDSMDEAHGPEFRNDAQLAAKRYFADQGFSKAKPPPAAAMSSRLEAEYLKLKLAKAEAGASEEGGKTETVPGDPGTGGTAVIGESTQFKNAAEAAAALVESGEAAGLDWD